MDLLSSFLCVFVVCVAAQTDVESSQPDCHVMSLVPWQCIPDLVVPFVHVLQRHGCIVLDNLGQGGALVKDHSKDNEL